MAVSQKKFVAVSQKSLGVGSCYMIRTLVGGVGVQHHHHS